MDDVRAHRRSKCETVPGFARQPKTLTAADAGRRLGVEDGFLFDDAM
uniref:Uncharacterized protein n=1 Tax=Rhizophora mucronata TaxID=61149 RepID=A0A2P2JRT7_RHIMU